MTKKHRAPGRATSTYMPESLRRLQGVLEQLHLEGLPPMPPGIQAAAGRVKPTSTQPADVVEGRQRRRSLERALRRVGDLAESIAFEAAGGRGMRRGWRCPECHRFQRETAAFCDSCQPQVPRP